MPTTYYINYTDGSSKTFEAENDKEALHYFRMEGDHAIDFGREPKSALNKSNHCCETMIFHVQMKCPDGHTDLQCPDRVILVLRTGEYGLIIHDGGSSSYVINFCPFCGVELK